jgi:hypothetical protein
MLRTYIEKPKQTELFWNKPKQTKTTINFLQKYPNMLSFKLFGLVFWLFQFIRNIETLCFDIEAKEPKQTVLKQTEKKRNNRNKRFVSDSAETSFGSSFGGFEWKLVSKDTLGFYMAF